MTRMSVARIAETLQRDFRSAASQLRQTGRRLRTTSRHYLDAADILDNGPRPSNDIRPDLLINLRFHTAWAQRRHHPTGPKWSAYSGEYQPRIRAPRRWSARPSLPGS